MNVREQIVEAFAATPRPCDDAIAVESYDDEGTAEYFHGRAWQGHPAERLRYFSSSMSFFTPEAFRYFLPAYMLAELDDPKEADIIAESIAFHFDRFTSDRRPPFTAEELRGVRSFFKECARRYADGVSDRKYNKAARKIDGWIAELA
jgi:hypothetical protein